LLNDKEKSNVVKIINSILNSKKPITYDMLINIFDHFMMLQKIKNFDNSYELFATNYETFNKEHEKLTKICNKINKGISINYVFSKELINHIESPICNDDGIFYPIILKRSEDYLEESEFMHHCVSAYDNREKSIIISLRTEDGDERVTSEYDNVIGMKLQESYFNNNTPPENFKKALNELNKRVIKAAGKKILKWVEKNREILEINGIPVININEIHEMAELPF
jgi:hypothetical protein